ncbi:AI-2E family transporter [Jiulongibacter sediminis]|uniref:AI-2E family transporter n=1 Tax=Jiulongibacter sediminis TaxID=1605367 RepID=UPI00103C79B2|nr:AI-2E family transporter [Jiulongibacter sediminis]
MRARLKKENLPGVLIAVSLIVLVLVYLKSILIPLILALLLSVAVAPAVNWLKSKGWNKIVASFTGIALVALIFSFLSYLIISELGEFNDRQDQIMNKMAHYNNLLIEKFRGNRIGESLVRIYKKEVTTEEYLTEFFENSSGSLQASFDFIVNVALIPIYMFFFLVYSDFFIFGIRRMFKDFDTSNYIKLIDSSKRAIQSYFQGFVKVTLILAVLNCIGLYIIGVENALFYGVFAALLCIIPYIGIFIGSLLPAFMALITLDSPWYAVAVIGWMSFVQFLEGNFITPFVVGDKVKINPFMVLIFLLIAGKIWGIPGLVVAVPMAAVFKQICEHVPFLAPLGSLMHSFPEDPEKTKNKRLRVSEVST